MTECEELKSLVKKRSPSFVASNSTEIIASLIVVNRNGIEHLKTLLPSLILHTDAIKYELILVDNASTDDSVPYFESYFQDKYCTIPYQLIQNRINESFSAANNSAAKLAKGKYLILLNNDIEPLSGWLNYLIDTAESIADIGSVGARLVYPFRKERSWLSRFFKKQKNNSCLIQHAGIAFANEGVQFRPYNLSKGKSIDDSEVLKSGKKSALTAACLLIPKEAYIEVGGLDEAYNYGGEDVDLGLKLLEAGYCNYYCADSVLYHHEFGTQSKEKQVKAASRRKKNLKIFQERWFLLVKKKYWTEKIYNKSNLYAETPLQIASVDTGFKLSEEDKEIAERYGWKIVSTTQKEVKKINKGISYDFILAQNDADTLRINNQQHSFLIEKRNWLELFRTALVERYLNSSIVIKIAAKTWKGTYSWGDFHMAVLLKQELEKLGHYVLIQIFPEWDNDEGLECDVAIVMRGVCKYEVKPQQINIMWNISHPDDVSLDEYEQYDKVFIASELWAKKLSEQISTPVETMLQCTDIERFKPPDNHEKAKYHQQLLFVGNSRGVYRKALQDLLPTNFDLAVYGRRWGKIIPRKFIKGEYIPNDELYLHYGSADILLNDHWDDMRHKGFISNRLFDGLACGAFILSDKVNAMGELENFVQTYESPDELNTHIEHYINADNERSNKASKGMEFVRENHTFKHRAETFSKTIERMMEKVVGKIN